MNLSKTISAPEKKKNIKYAKELKKKYVSMQKEMTVHITFFYQNTKYSGLSLPV